MQFVAVESVRFCNILEGLRFRPQDPGLRGVLPFRVDSTGRRSRRASQRGKREKALFALGFVLVSAMRSGYLNWRATKCELEMVCCHPSCSSSVCYRQLALLGLRHRAPEIGPSIRIQQGSMSSLEPEVKASSAMRG